MSTIAIPTTELQYVDARANADKFYRVYVVKDTVVTQYGRNGAYGTFGRKVYSSQFGALTAAAKVIESKQAKGYVTTLSCTLLLSDDPGDTEYYTDGELDRQANRKARAVIRNGPVMPARQTDDNTVSQKDIDEALASIMSTVETRRQSAVVAAGKAAGTNLEVLGKVSTALERFWKPRVVVAPTGKTRPMLAETINPVEVDARLDDQAWVCQPKLDGDRVVVEVVNGIVTALNRTGQPKVKNVGEHHLAPFRGLTQGRWVFDGEVVGRKLWLFDMPAAGPFHGETQGFTTRHFALTLTIEALGIGKDSEDIGIVAVSTGTEDKRELLRYALEAGREGIMFRNANASYSPARRSPDLLKFKFVKEADCEVVSLDPVKSSVVLGVRDRDDAVQIVGAASTIGKGVVAVGDVLEIRYLYVVNADHPRMFQPRIMRKRTDKNPAECSIEQFRNAVTDRTVAR